MNVLNKIKSKIKSQYSYCASLSVSLNQPSDGGVDVSAGIIDRLRIAVYILDELYRLRQLAILINSGRFDYGPNPVARLNNELDDLIALDN